MDSNNNANQPIGEKVLAAAKKGQLKMKPRWHFILRAALWATGITIAALALVYLSSLFIFITWRSGIWVAPLFGWRGFLVFLVSAPWLILLLAAVFAVILEILARHYSFGWRQPLLYLSAAVLLIVALGGVLVAVTPLHRIISRCPAGSPPRPLQGNPVGMYVGRPPCGEGIYRNLRPARLDKINKGVVVQAASSRLTITNQQEESLTVLITPRTRLPFGMDFSLGDNVVVVGQRRGDQIEAFGISEVSD